MKKNNLSSMIIATVIAVMMVAIPIMGCATAQKDGQADVTTEQTVTTQAKQDEDEGALTMQMGDGNEQPNGQMGQPPAAPNGQTGEAPNGEMHLGSGEEDSMQMQGRDGHKHGRDGELTGEPGQMPEGMGQRGEQDTAKSAGKQGLPAWAVAAISGGAGLVIGAGVMFIIMKAAKKHTKENTEQKNEQVNKTENEAKKEEKAGDAMDQAQVNE